MLASTGVRCLQPGVVTCKAFTMIHAQNIVVQKILSKLRGMRPHPPGSATGCPSHNLLRRDFWPWQCNKGDQVRSTDYPCLAYPHQPSSGLTQISAWRPVGYPALCLTRETEWLHCPACHQYSRWVTYDQRPTYRAEGCLTNWLWSVIIIFSPLNLRAVSGPVGRCCRPLSPRHPGSWLHGCLTSIVIFNWFELFGKITNLSSIVSNWSIIHAQFLSCSYRPSMKHGKADNFNDNLNDQK